MRSHIVLTILGCIKKKNTIAKRKKRKKKNKYRSLHGFNYCVARVLLIGDTATIRLKMVWRLLLSDARSVKPAARI